MNARVHVCPSAAEAAAQCAAAMAKALGEALERAQAASVALSGGATPALLFDALAAMPLAWERVHFFFVDERCVPPSSPQSNFRLAQERLFDPVGAPTANQHRIEGEREPAQAAERYAEQIRSFFGCADPVFDALHLGMGPDAHTASLFPGEALLADRSGIAAALYSASRGQWRVTLLPGVILRARSLLMLAAGADKAEAARWALEGPTAPLECPAQLAAGGAWFLDSAAASRLG